MILARGLHTYYRDSRASAQLAREEHALHALLGV